jgi:serine protease inhibitor
MTSEAFSGSWRSAVSAFPAALRRITSAAAAIGFLLGGAIVGAAPADNRLALSAADTGFGLGLLNQVYRQQPGSNIFISSYSVATVLQMIGNGAVGATRAEIARTLGTAGMEAEAVNHAHLEMNQLLRGASSNVVLTTANAIWHQPGVTLQAPFVAANREFYGADIRPLDFTDPRAAGALNAWAAEQTQGRIKRILEPPIPGDTMLILANAIYFKGKWASPFDRKATEDRPFTLYGGQHETMPMMRQRGHFRYAALGEFQAIRLPYEGGRLGMCVLLPGSNSTPANLLARLDARFWQTAIAPQLQEAEGTVVLPRFRIEYGIELKDALQTMGIHLAFQGGDFSAMADLPLSVSKVAQKSFVEVNEEGTEAAAVTTGVMAATAMKQRRPPFEMIVDRPFLFLIYDELSQELLFEGVVFEPIPGIPGA